MLDATSSEHQPLFYARFNQPTLKFICDHDALLRLTFEKGDFIFNGAMGHKGQSVTIPADLNIDFRVNFETRVVGNDLQIDGAVVASVKPPLPTGQDAFLRYMTQYLELLHDAGNHVFYSLPQFSPRTSMDIDFTLIDHSEDFAWQESICGITVDQINSYLASLWLKSALLTHTKIGTKNSDWRLRSLTEFVKREDGLFFRIKFGAPRVHILCSREVVVYFDVYELEFFPGPDLSVAPEKKFMKWKIALMMNVLPMRDPEGHSVTVSLDVSSARYHHGLSKYPDIQEADVQHDHYCNIIVDFFSDEYLQILRVARYHIIYSHHALVQTVGSVEFTGEAEGSWGQIEVSDPGPHSGKVPSRDTIQHAKMYGFDQVVAISQDSINAQFSMLSHALFRTWSYSEAFSATFKPLSMQLLTGNRAIVWVHLASGQLKTLRDGKPDNECEPYEFKQWRAAFEVELKSCNQAELEGHSSATYKATSAYQKHGNKDDRVLRHIYLDLSSAEYLHDYSHYSNINAFSSPEEGRSTMLKLEALVWYLTEHYFCEIRKEGLNVIFSIPVFKASPSSYALTSMLFHVYSKVEVTRYNWTHIPAGMEPVIVILGTTGSRPLPADHLEYSTGWVVQANRGFSHGTIGISRRAFIEERLLRLLSNVNALTTLIPIMIDPLKGFHGVSLKKWAEHEQRKDRPSNWRLIPSDGSGYLKYLWEHCEEWRYKLSGNGEIDASQGISCVTRNYVELPTAVKHGALHIKVSGRVELGLSLQTGKAKSYNTSSAVCWSTNVALETIGSGIKVSTFGSREPQISEVVFTDGSAGKFRNPADMLREAFPSKVDLHELVEEIQAFEGAWEYCYPPATPYSLASPAFNADGDLLFELRRHGATTSRAGGPLSPTAKTGRALTPLGRRPGSRAGMRNGNKSPPPHSSSSHPFSAGGASLGGAGLTGRASFASIASTTVGTTVTGGATAHTVMGEFQQIVSGAAGAKVTPVTVLDSSSG
ncbi:hypothetical protein BN946_scf184649.g23 [Trametes cinnabarina]|uniref:Uncharacterized protein n=1 Tax=Pycnoporus cinnabarinus TaxID=5643 RepID=A0A060SNI3_PYCCI|nr:hypothetical protein BN946_scf184649.g23 [Trametes cinnabarina]